jgi:glutaredoxin-related protein
MQKKATFYHAGCNVCVSAEQNLATALDPKRYQVESVHLGTNKTRLEEARRAGVKSVPALVMDDGAVFHINFGASLSDIA